MLARLLVIILCLWLVWLVVLRLHIGSLVSCKLDWLLTKFWQIKVLPIVYRVSSCALWIVRVVSLVRKVCDPKKIARECLGWVNYTATSRTSWSTVIARESLSLYFWLITPLKGSVAQFHVEHQAFIRLQIVLLHVGVDRVRVRDLWKAMVSIKLLLPALIILLLVWVRRWHIFLLLSSIFYKLDQTRFQHTFQRREIVEVFFRVDFSAFNWKLICLFQFGQVALGLHSVYFDCQVLNFLLIRLAWRECQVALLRSAIPRISYFLSCSRRRSLARSVGYFVDVRFVFDCNW